jgi:serine/threonine-protein kinase ULK/ATG1
LPEIEALRLFGQLIKGMNSMKAMNIIHRDLKPANIMLKNGNIKIVDFGLARKFFNGELMKTYVGSPMNMAP